MTSKINIMIPKAYVHIKQVMVITPTEEQLLTFFNEYGLNTIEEILDEFNNSWELVLREWFVNTNFNPDFKNYQVDNNIFRFNSDNEDDEVQLMTDQEFNNIKNDELIF